MSYGVSPDGFELKGFDAILNESVARAKEVFDNPDLSSTSALRKILEVTAAEDAELWKRMEALYYSNFVSTAYGESLDRLGEDLGVPRDHRFTEAKVRFTLEGGKPQRSYELPAGTVVTTSDRTVAFHTLEARTLTASDKQADVAARAFERGPLQLPASGLSLVDPDYSSKYLQLGTATLTVETVGEVGGGEEMEDDEDYRPRLLARPRNMWTLESVRREVADVVGVLDVLVSDDLGGVDVSQSYFNLFDFAKRPFSADRRLGEPYFFDIVVAHDPAWDWSTTNSTGGVYERVLAAADRVRPAGIHANVAQADHIEVGVRARVTMEAGHDPRALVASVMDRLAHDIGALRLGGAVLYSQTLRAFVEQPGVVDVQGLHLRRRPPLIGRMSFGGVPFQSGDVEVAVGANLPMSRTEIALFRIESDLIEIEVSQR